MIKFNARTYLLAKQDPAMALLAFCEEMEAKNEKRMVEIRATIVREMKDELQTLIREETRYAAEQELKGRKALHLLSETEKEDVAEMATERALVKIPKFFPKDGYSPKKGQDYWTPQEVNQVATYLYGLLKKDLTLTAGTDYPTREQMQTFVEVEVQKMPKYSETELFAKLKLQFPKLELKGEEIILKINALPLKAPYFIPASRISGLPKAMRPRQISGSGKGAGLGTAALLTVAGTIDDSNVTFTVSEEPAVLLINGGMFRKTGGSITWSYSGGTITLSVAVGVSGAIYGIR